MKNTWRSRYTVKYFLYALATLLFVSGNVAQAVGPVDVASLPGGATVFDSDGGSGEQWGRAGGRTINYSGFVLANFTELEWRSISAGMAFDGEITGATFEEMAGPLLIAPNALQWSGETTITNDITASIETVYTRFTVVADTIFSGPPPLAIDIFLAGANFEINVLFEASLNPGGPYQPALDFFDAYPTPVGHGGFAITSFSHGFWFEQLVGMTLEEHDSNMQGRFDDVDGAIDYLTIESINRLVDIAATVIDNNDKLIWVKSDLEELLNAGAGDWATEEDIDFLREFLSGEHDDIRDRLSESQSLMLCMWIGNDLIPVCPDEIPPGLPSLLALTTGQADIMDKLEWAKLDIEALSAQLAAGQAELIEKLDWAKMDIEALSAQLAANREIDVTAVKSPRASGKKDHIFMVFTTVNGVPVDAVVTSVTAVTESEEDGIGVVSPPYDIAAVSAGFQSVDVDVSDDLSSTKTVIITVEYIDGDNTLQGATLVSDW